MVANIAQQILNENRCTTADITITNLESLIDNAIDYINLMAGTSIADLAGGLTGTADAGGNVTTTIDAERTEVDHYWNAFYIKYVTGLNIDQYRLVSHFDAATDTMTHTAFVNAVALGDTYIMGTAAGLLPFKSLAGTANEITVVKSLSTLLLRAYLDKGPNISLGSISITSVLTDPHYNAYSDIVQKGMDRLKETVSSTTGIAFSVGSDDADLV